MATGGELICTCRYSMKQKGPVYRDLVLDVSRVAMVSWRHFYFSNIQVYTL